MMLLGARSSFEPSNAEPLRRPVKQAVFVGDKKLLQPRKIMVAKICAVDVRKHTAVGKDVYRLLPMAHRNHDKIAGSGCAAKETHFMLGWRALALWAHHPQRSK
jgi:hypothetical protein